MRCREVNERLAASDERPIEVVARIGCKNDRSLDCFDTLQERRNLLIGIANSVFPGITALADTSVCLVKEQGPGLCRARSKKPGHRIPESLGLANVFGPGIHLIHDFLRCLWRSGRNTSIENSTGRQAPGKRTRYCTIFQSEIDIAIGYFLIAKSTTCPCCLTARSTRRRSCNRFNYRYKFIPQAVQLSL